MLTMAVKRNNILYHIAQKGKHQETHQKQFKDRRNNVCPPHQRRSIKGKTHTDGGKSRTKTKDKVCRNGRANSRRDTGEAGPLADALWTQRVYAMCNKTW